MTADGKVETMDIFHALQKFAKKRTKDGNVDSLFDDRLGLPIAVLFSLGLMVKFVAFDAKARIVKLVDPKTYEVLSEFGYDEFYAELTRDRRRKRD